MNSAVKATEVAKAAFDKIKAAIEKNGNLPEIVHLTCGDPQRDEGNRLLKELCKNAGYDINFVESEEPLDKWAAKQKF